MAQREGASAVYSGVLRETPAGPVAVWVTRHGVRRVGDVTPDMLDEEGSDVARSATLASALLQLREYFAGDRRKFDLSLDFSGATAFQNAAKQLAAAADLVLVVGAPASSNSSRLVEVAARRGARSVLIQNADEIEPDWLEGAACVGVTAGASTPEFLVQQVVDRLCALGGPETQVSSLEHVDEGVTFKLPVELRS